MATAIGIIGLLAAVVLLMYLVYKGLNVVVMTIVCSLLIMVTSGMPLAASFSSTYLARLGQMIGILGGIFILGALIGALYDASGAAYSLVKFFSKYVRTENPRIKTLVSVLCIMIITIGLGYFGVDSLVLLFLTTPICAEFCRQNDWDSKFVAVLIMSGPLANILPGTIQTYNLIPMRYLGTTAMASALPGFIACAVGFVLILLYTSRSIDKSVAAGEHFIENDVLKSNVTVHDKYPNPLISFIPLLVLFILFNGFHLAIEISMMVGALLAVILFWKYIPSVPKTLNTGIGNAARTTLNFGALMGFANVAMSTPVFSNLINFVANNENINPVLVVITAVALMTGVSNSANSGITAAMEAFADAFVARGVSPTIIHRAATLTGATLDTLPTNSGVIISLNMTGSTHKKSYKYIFVNTVAIPCVVVAVYAVFAIFFPGIC